MSLSHTCCQEPACRWQARWLIGEVRKKPRWPELSPRIKNPLALCLLARPLSFSSLSFPICEMDALSVLLELCKPCALKQRTSHCAVGSVSKGYKNIATSPMMGRTKTKQNKQLFTLKQNNSISYSFEPQVQRTTHRNFGD